MSELQSMIENMTKLAKVEAAQEFAGQTAAWEAKLLDAQRRATRAEAQAAQAQSREEIATAALAKLQAALADLVA